MRITCPQCDAVLKSDGELPAGKAIRCPKCETTFSVPAAAPRKAAYVGDEDDDEYEVRPARRRKQDKKSGVAMIVIPIVLLCLVVFGALGGGAFYVWSKYLRDEGKDVLTPRVVERKGPPPFAGGNQPPVGLGAAPVLGKEAPEIEGVDADSKQFKLSDYRGKVVVLDFWAGWCGPCKALVPHEREFVDRLKSNPKFVFIGVNLDPSAGELKRVERELKINWRSFSDGQNGPITQQWAVKYIPALFVIDHKGVIRYRDLPPEMLDKAVETLLNEAEGTS